MDYINKLDVKYLSSISFARTTNFNIINKNKDNQYSQVTNSVTWTILPSNPNPNNEGAISNFDILAGEINEDERFVFVAGEGVLGVLKLFGKQKGGAFRVRGLAVDFYAPFDLSAVAVQLSVAH